LFDAPVYARSMSGWQHRGDDDNAPSPQLMSDGVELRRQLGLPRASPTQSPANHSLSPEPSASVRASGTGSAHYEVCVVLWLCL